MSRIALMLAAAAAWLSLAAPAGAAPRSAQSLFAEGCGGCHGLEGRSVSDLIPDLKDQVGHYLCVPEGRAYLGRLPNVAFSATTDTQLAAVLNYVVFTLGGTSAPPKTRPYSAAEAGRLRRAPLTSTDLVAQRSAIVERVIAECGAPDSLRTYKRDQAPPMTVPGVSR